MPVRLVLTSDDGWVADSFEAVVEGVLETYVEVRVDELSISEYQGALLQQMIENGAGEPVELTWVSAGVGWDWFVGNGTLFVTGGMYGGTADLGPWVEFGWGQQL